MNVGNGTNGSLTEKETFRFNIEIPWTGLTLSVCVTTGHIIVYGSFSTTNPNSAVHDFYLEIHVPHQQEESESEECREVFIKPSINEHSSQCIHNPITPSDNRKRSASHSSPDNNIVYLSIIGKDDNNSFVMNTTYGNTLDIISPTTSPTEGI